MKKEMKKYILATCSFLALFGSCKKSDDDVEKNNWRIPMIKTETTNNNVITYWYNEEGRLVKQENGDWIRTEFMYTQDSVYYKKTEIATNAVQKYAGKLNANGMLISQDGTDYTFDGNNRLIETLFPPQSNGWQRRNKYYYNSTTGLLDSMRQSEGLFLQTRWIQTTIYTYYAGLDNTNGNENRGMGIWGKNHPHPEKHSDTWSPIAAAPYRKITFTTDKNYSYDEQGRIVVEDHAETRPDNTTAQWRTVYTYY